MRIIEIVQPSVSQEVSRFVSGVFSDLKSQYPDVAGFITRLVFTHRLTSEFNQFNRELRISCYGLDSSVETANLNIEKSHKPGFTVCNSLQTLVTHEFGHAVDNYVVVTGDEDAKDDWFAAKKQLREKLGFPSEYARKGLNEWFAERFTAEIIGREPKVLLRITADFITRVSAHKIRPARNPATSSR